MNEKPPASTSLFLNEDVDKPPSPEKGDLRRRLHRVMEKKASSMKDRMSSMSRSRVKGFLKRNLFVLFTVAAVALGESSHFDLLVFSAGNRLDLTLCVCTCRCDPGLRCPSSSPDSEGDQILLFSWRTPDEDATDACAAAHHFQSGDRLAMQNTQF